MKLIMIVNSHLFLNHCPLGACPVAWYRLCHSEDDLGAATPPLPPAYVCVCGPQIYHEFRFPMPKFRQSRCRQWRVQLGDAREWKSDIRWQKFDMPRTWQMSDKSRQHPVALMKANCCLAISVEKTKDPGPETPEPVAVRHKIFGTWFRSSAMLPHSDSVSIWASLLAAIGYRYIYTPRFMMIFFTHVCPKSWR